KADAFASQVFGQLDIGAAIADHVGMLHVQLILCQVINQQTGMGFAVGAVFVLEGIVNEDFLEFHAFVAKGGQHLFVGFDEIFLRKRVRTPAVLVGNHDQGVPVVT